MPTLIRHLRCTALILAGAILCGCASTYNGSVADRPAVFNSIGMTLMKIESGSFMMGSPQNETGRDASETQHRVTLTKPFFMDSTHVTIGQWKAFMSDTGYVTEADKQGWGMAWTGQKWERVNGANWRNPGFPQQDDHPVVDVSWNDAMAFCNWLSHKEGKHYRLPTESEFEYCARAGTQTIYPWGDNPDDGKGWANLADQTFVSKHPGASGFNWTDGYEFTAPVGSFKANAWGLYDMTGNAWQWCSDWYGKYPQGDVTDPHGPSQQDAPVFKAPETNLVGPDRVMRGGSWHSSIVHARSANRDHAPPDLRNCIKGFRVVMDVD
jgi:formylglycine-generating enzyme required for sulfatase activity